LQLQLDTFTELEIGFIFSPVRNCSLCLPYDPLKLSSICSSGNQKVRHICWPYLVYASHWGC